MNVMNRQARPADEPSTQRPGAVAVAGDDVLGALFREISAGSPEALAKVFEASGRALYGLALWRTGCPEDAADVVQEVFVRLVAHRSKLAAVRSPGAWLLTVAHRLSVDAGRRRARRRESSSEGLELLHAPVGDPARAVDAARASALLAELPPAQRETVYLRHYQDLGFAAIGAITGVPTFTAASRYRLGLARLRRLMGRP